MDIRLPVYRLVLHALPVHPRRRTPAGPSGRARLGLVVLSFALGACATGTAAPWSGTPTPRHTAPNATGDPRPLLQASGLIRTPPARSPAASLAPSSGPSPVSATAGRASEAPASPAASPDPGASLPAATFEPAAAAALQRVVDRARANVPIPGISVAVRLADGRTWTGVSGDRQLTPRRPVEPDTVFGIASITKTFVTAAVLQLVDEGRLSLDSRLARFVPDFPRAKRITIRQLLGHTSGVHDYFGNPEYVARVFADTGRRWTRDEILDLALDPYCDPGDCFRYSNTNFVLLGLVVEKVTGQGLASVIRERLIAPLGLERTVFQVDEPTPRDAAHGHLWGGGAAFYDQTGRSRVIPHLSAASVAWAAGAMAASASDLATWAAALYTGQVVPEPLLEEMLTFRRRDEYGLGTRTRVFDGRRAVGHLGEIRGFEGAMWYFTREGVSIVLLSNRGLYDTDRVVRRLARELFARLDVPEPEGDRGRDTG